MKVRLVNFHCLINLDDAILGCGTFIITDDRAILYEDRSIVYLALINTHTK